MNKIMHAKDAAIDLIRHYVLRGDSLDSLRKSYLGSYGGEYDASIQYDLIQVSELNGKECDHSFKLKKIYQEIISGQMKLINI